MAGRKLRGDVVAAAAEEVKMARYRASVGWSGHQCRCADSSSAGGEMLEMSSHANGARMTTAMQHRGHVDADEVASTVPHSTPAICPCRSRRR